MDLSTSESDVDRSTFSDPSYSGSTAWVATSSSKNSARPSSIVSPITRLATAATSGLAFPIATPRPALATIGTSLTSSPMATIWSA